MCHSAVDLEERRCKLLRGRSSGIIDIARQRGRRDDIVWRREMICAQMDRENRDVATQSIHPC